MSLSSPLFRFRAMMLFFILGLIASGVTAFPLLTELRILATALGAGTAQSPEGYSGLTYWIVSVRCGLEQSYDRFPWLAYGTDWLAFAHIIIAVFFVGALIDPLASRWTLHSGMFACIAVIPLALICGPIRGIPLYWRLIDCSFGILGILPLVYCLRLLRQINSAKHHLSS